MAELLFILVTLYVAYVVFKVVECEKQQKQAKSPPSKAKAAAAPKPQVSVKSEPVAKKPAPAKPAPVSKTPATKTTNSTTLEPGTLKNPETGEVSKIASNYRFMKRWIKEALVNEGLLEKIYKNTELDKETIAKINEALEKLKAMAKYQ